MSISEEVVRLTTQLDPVNTDDWVVDDAQVIRLYGAAVAVFGRLLTTHPSAPETI